MGIFKMFLTLALVAAPGLAAAGCLTSLTTSGSVVSKVRGLYVNRAGNGHFVILDKATCVASPTGDAVLGSITKDYHYLRVRDDDKALFSLLMASQAQGLTVEFRINPGAAVGDVNDVGYAVSPANAATQ